MAILSGPVLKRMMSQLRVRPATIACDLLATPIRDGQGAVRMGQLNFRDQ